MMRILFAVFAVLLLAAGAHARLDAPRVVSPHNADAYSMKTFAQFHRWRDLEGDRLAWALYEYLTDKQSGLFPLGDGAREGLDGTYDHALVRDPVKIINVYGYAYCDVLGPTMAGIWHDMGLGKSRTVNLPDWGHVLAEVRYNGGWHYLDLDVRAAFRRPDGTLASMADAKRDDSLWVGPRGPRFFPMDDLKRVRKVYAKTPALQRHGVHMTGHTMDYVLRRGETFTRWWKPQDGRWNHLSSYNKKDFLRRLLGRPPAGPKCKHAGFTVHTHANGRFVYQPNLTDRSSDFTDGVYDARNVRSSANGLTLAAPGEGYAIFEVRTPYIIVPLVGDQSTTDDDREASVVRVDAKSASISLSLDNGLTWRPLAVDAWPATIDLTRHVAGTYGYLLKIALNGQPGEAVVRSLAITTWVQVAPASLPSLRRGENRMEFRTGDHYGLQSRVVEIRPNAGNPEDFLKHLVARPARYDPASISGRVRGPLVAKVEASPRTKIAWFSAGASFNTHQQAAARNTRNSMAYAVGEPKDFRQIYRADVPPGQSHWHYNAALEVRLEQPAKTIFVRYVGDPAVNNIRVYAHCIDDTPRTPTPVTITHVWSENGARKSHTVTLDRPGAYDVTCAADPANVSIEMSVASDVHR